MRTFLNLFKQIHIDSEPNKNLFSVLRKNVDLLLLEEEDLLLEEEEEEDLLLLKERSTCLLKTLKRFLFGSLSIFTGLKRFKKGSHLNLSEKVLPNSA